MIKNFFSIQIVILLFFTAGLTGVVVKTNVYDDVKNGIVDVLCLSCIKLQPKTSADFTFQTANNKDHPEFVKEILKTEGPILIQYGESACKGCDLMIENVMEPYFNLTFPEKKPKSFETKIENRNLSFYYIYIFVDDNKNKVREESYKIYDKDNIDGFPMFTIITLEYDHSGDIKPYYTTLYGLFEGENYKKTKETFTMLLSESRQLYDRNIKGYN
jgi:hypothetical protein